MGFLGVFKLFNFFAVFVQFFGFSCRRNSVKGFPGFCELFPDGFQGVLACGRHELCVERAETNHRHQIGGRPYDGSRNGDTHRIKTTATGENSNRTPSGGFTDAGRSGTGTKNRASGAVHTGTKFGRNHLKRVSASRRKHSSGQNRR